MTTSGRPSVSGGIGRELADLGRKLATVRGLTRGRRAGGPRLAPEPSVGLEVWTRVEAWLREVNPEPTPEEIDEVMLEWRG